MRHGLGFQVEGSGALMNYGHDGGAPGMNAEFRVFPKLGIVAIGLSNLDPPVAERLITFYIFRMPAAPWPYCSLL
jgi:D-alanyl-D-alanine carboxypeptidase